MSSPPRQPLHEPLERHDTANHPYHSSITRARIDQTGPEIWEQDLMLSTAVVSEMVQIYGLVLTPPERLGDLINWEVAETLSQLRSTLTTCLFPLSSPTTSTPLIGSSSEEGYNWGARPTAHLNGADAPDLS
ncbi:hypothetical protein PtA15_10A154 [Puccinia triticina]|uniref:Rho-GAP domain-containing protein n=1 Tax=Puccinia triticina TaxID=208348 RepID=A0ABY7CUS2_9BASI|nr:uncharacterized protein PtA15_10A154 [Puccinia triticina]WAQ88735.1 hypothetical protein PtA15_10A154 [Puccinia triticina]